MPYLTIPDTLENVVLIGLTKPVGETYLEEDRMFVVYLTYEIDSNLDAPNGFKSHIWIAFGRTVREWTQKWSLNAISNYINTCILKNNEICFLTIQFKDLYIDENGYSVIRHFTKPKLSYIGTELSYELQR